MSAILAALVLIVSVVSTAALAWHGTVDGQAFVALVTGIVAGGGGLAGAIAVHRNATTQPAPPESTPPPAPVAPQPPPAPPVQA